MYTRAHGRASQPFSLVLAASVGVGGLNLAWLTNAPPDLASPPADPVPAGDL